MPASCRQVTFCGLSSAITPTRYPDSHDLRGRPVVPDIDRPTEIQIRVDGVPAEVLRTVGPQFRRQSDAAPFVPTQVDHDAAPSHRIRSIARSGTDHNRRDTIRRRHRSGTPNAAYEHRGGIEMSPCTSAMCSVPSVSTRYPKAMKSPCRFGSRVAATFSTSKSCPAPVFHQTVDGVHRQTVDLSEVPQVRSPLHGAHRR